MLTSFFKKLTGGKFLVLIIGVCLSLGAKLNAQEIEWQNTIGTSADEFTYASKQTPDGGYIIGGYTSANISGDKTDPSNGGTDFWILKLDAAGIIVWQNSIGGSLGDNLYTLEITADGGFIMGGSSNSNISGDKTENSRGGTDYWIVKTDATGNVQWDRTYGGSANDLLNSIKQTTDGGYIVAGYSKSGISGDKTENNQDTIAPITNDFWILKLDSLGNLQWQNTIGGDDDDLVPNALTSLDGGYLIGGPSYSDNTGDKTESNHSVYTDFWVIKLDASGAIQWQNTLGGAGGDNLNSIIATSDGHYILAGETSSQISDDKTEPLINNSVDIWVVKIDSIGNIVNQNNIGGEYSDLLDEAGVTPDGGFVLGGYSDSNIAGDKSEDSLGVEDFWIIKLDSSLNIKWQNTIGGNSRDYLWAMSATNDGGVICGGKSASGVSGDKDEVSLGNFDYWIVKVSGNASNISGKLFIDANSNSIQDVGEVSVKFHRITESITGRFAFSEQNGTFNVSVIDTGSFSVSPTAIPYYNTIPVAHAANFSALLQNDLFNDFAFQPAGVINDLNIQLTPLSAIRPGFNASYMVTYQNSGTTTLSGIIKMYPANVLSYISSSLSTTSVSTDSIEWNINALSPFQSQNFFVTFQVSPLAVNGTVAISTAIFLPVSGDATPLNNTSSSSVIITGSYDPNDILVSEDTLTTTQLATQPYLDYTIRFQNTGNDTAFTVKIINPIDTNRLNLQTIELLNSSHPVQLKWVNYNRNMEFLFENILLPDSNINEPQSHGFVTYRIKPKTSLLAGDSVTNKAYIYFDFNAPVETNTATTKIILPTSINELAKGSGQLAVFPNPAKDELNIQLNNSKANNLITVSIFDVLGNTVLSKQSATANCKLPTDHFSKGIYFVEVKTGKQVYRSKFVKE